jgi:hypothetical protein
MFRNLATSAAVSLLSACAVVALPPDTESDESVADNHPIDSDCDCAAECNANGYYCAEAATCTCGAHIDESCATGASNLCECLMVLDGYACTSGDWIAYYATCYKFEVQPDAGQVLCFSVYYPPQECASAVDACMK